MMKSSESERDPKRPTIGILLILAAYLALGVTYSLVTPLFEASDEMWHYPFVKHLADGHSLPVQQVGVEQPWRQEGSQPPLYYALAALVTSWIDTSDMSQVLWRNPHADIGIPKLDGNVNMVIHTAREGWPYRGTVLAVRLIRWLSVLMGAATVYCTYLIGRDLGRLVLSNPEQFGKIALQEALACGAAAFVAFNPMFLFISGSINNDNLATTLSAFALWRTLRLLEGEDRPKHLLLLGLTLGLAALSKASALGLFPLVALALLIAAWRARPQSALLDWRKLFYGGAAIFGLAALVAGWWFWRNWRLYGDPLGLNAFVAIVGPRYPVPTLRQLWGERVGFTMSFWGFFGGMNVPMAQWLYRLLDVLAALSLPGLALFFWQERRKLTGASWLKLLFIAAWPAVVFVSLIRWTLMTIATQGRLMFAAISAIATLMVLGWMYLAPRRYRAAPVLTVSVLFFALAVAAPFVFIAPAYARPPLLSEQDIPSEVTRAQARFGDRMELVGYRLATDTTHPGETLAVTLYWRALAKMETNYSVFVHLLGENDLILGQRDMYPGHGTYPTSLWQAGDLIADTYIVPVSPATLAPATSQFEIGLYQLETQTRLKVTGNDGASLGDAVRFGKIEIAPRASVDGLPNPVYFNLDNQIALVGYAVDRTALSPGETLRLTLYWRAIGKTKANYSVFTHILGENHQLWAQKDAWPQNGNAPTSIWKLGQTIEDQYDLVVKNDAPAGAWDIEIGMYSETGQRLNLLGEGGHVQDNRILLGKVRIVRP
jgi:hypothetical protein